MTQLRFTPSPGVRRMMSLRMSWLSVGLRDIGLGSLVDALDGAEPAIKTAVAQAADSPPVVQVEDNTVTALATAGQTVIQNTLNKVIPGAGTVEAEVSTPFLAGLEAFVEHFFQNGTTTTTVETAPPAA